MTQTNPLSLPRQDAFKFLDELLAWGQFCSRNDVAEAMVLLQHHLEIDEAAVKVLLVEWMEQKQSLWS